MTGLETSAAQVVARAAVMSNVKAFMVPLFLEFLEFGLLLFPSIIEIGDGLVNPRLHFGRQGLQGLGTFGFSRLTRHLRISGPRGRDDGVPLRAVGRIHQGPLILRK